MAVSQTPQKRYQVQRTFLVVGEQKFIRQTLLTTDDLLLAQAQVQQEGGCVFDTETERVWTSHYPFWHPRFIGVPA